MSASSSMDFDSADFQYEPCPGNGSRSPCPALNSLANHGFIARNGKNLTFFEVVHAVVLVYNTTYPLAFFLTIVGFITCGHLSLSQSPLSTPQRKGSGLLQWALSIALLLLNFTLSVTPRLVLDLSSLSRRGRFKIAHDASFVHPDSVPSVAPDAALLEKLLEYSAGRGEVDGEGTPRGGLGLMDIAQFHARRVEMAPHPLSNLHLQISLGECALIWQVLRGDRRPANSDAHDEPEAQARRVWMLEGEKEGVIPVARLRQWFGEERLPDGWWDVGEGGVRPQYPVGLVKTRSLANLIGVLAAKNAHKIL